MILDENLVFSESQDISGNAGTTENSTSEVYIPRGVDHKGTAANSRYNVSGKLFFNGVCEDTDLAAAADSCALKIELFNHSATGAVSGGAAILTVDLTIAQVASIANKQKDGSLLFSVPLPVTQLAPYFEVKYSRATQNLSTGKVTVWIGGAPQLGQ